MQFLPYLVLEGRGGVEGRRERGKGRRKRKGNRRGERRTIHLERNGGRRTR